MRLACSGIWIVILSLVVSCQLIRSLPAPAPLSFRCEVQVEAQPLYLSHPSKTKLILTLTPNNEETRASSLSLTKWRLPKGMHGLLWDKKGKAITADTPLSWGEHVWWYSPHNPGKHTITLHMREPGEEETHVVVLDPIEVLEPAAAGTTAGQPIPFSVSAWIGPLPKTSKHKYKGETRK